MKIVDHGQDEPRCLARAVANEKRPVLLPLQQQHRILHGENNIDISSSAIIQRFGRIIDTSSQNRQLGTTLSLLFV